MSEKCPTCGHPARHRATTSHGTSHTKHYEPIHDRVAELEMALPDPDRLETLADWLDIDDVAQRRVGHDEVQRDLRYWAVKARAARFGSTGEMERLRKALREIRRRDECRLVDGCQQEDVKDRCSSCVARAAVGDE